MEEMRNGTKLLSGNIKVNKIVGRPRRRWNDYIKMDFTEIRRGC
jgi:hypothetical protein